MSIVEIAKTIPNAVPQGKALGIDDLFGSEQPIARVAQTG